MYENERGGSVVMICAWWVACVSSLYRICNNQRMNTCRTEASSSLLTVVARMRSSLSSVARQSQRSSSPWPALRTSQPPAGPQQRSSYRTELRLPAAHGATVTYFAPLAWGDMTWSPEPVLANVSPRHLPPKTSPIPRPNGVNDYVVIKANISNFPLAETIIVVR